MLQMTKREYATKPADYRSMIDGKPYLLTMDKTTGGTVLTPVILKANPTLATAGINYDYYIEKAERIVNKILYEGKKKRVTIDPNQLSLF